MTVCLTYPPPTFHLKKMVINLHQQNKRGKKMKVTFQVKMQVNDIGCKWVNDRPFKQLL